MQTFFVEIFKDTNTGKQMYSKELQPIEKLKGNLKVTQMSATLKTIWVLKIKAKPGHDLKPKDVSNL